MGERRGAWRVSVEKCNGKRQGRVILKWILRKWRNGLIWLIIGTDGGHL
jgi:ABC-type molybdenum transport system ATPase subunit/photorepair protein PhrA